MVSLNWKLVAPKVKYRKLPSGSVSWKSTHNSKVKSVTEIGFTGSSKFLIFEVERCMYLCSEQLAPSQYKSSSQ